jgi:serine/threonine protein kinase
MFEDARATGRRALTCTPSYACFSASLRACLPPHGVQELIGQGAYGIVCSAFDLQKQTMVAVKKIENVFDHRSLAKRTLRELKIVRSLQHENILGLERVIRPHQAVFSNIYMISELMETDLACVIRSPQELTEEHWSADTSSMHREWGSELSWQARCAASRAR